MSDALRLLIEHGDKMAALHRHVGKKGLRVPPVPDCLTIAETWARLVDDVRRTERTAG